MYIILIQLRRSDEQVNYYKEAHEIYLKEQAEEGNFIVSGNRTPNTGEVILSCLPDMESLYEVLQEDPFYKNRIGQYEIIEFDVKMKCEKLAGFIEENEDNS
jgi:uncharacterized protein YciI